MSVLKELSGNQSGVMAQPSRGKKRPRNEESTAEEGQKKPRLDLSPKIVPSPTAKAKPVNDDHVKKKGKKKQNKKGKMTVKDIEKTVADKEGVAEKKGGADSGDAAPKKKKNKSKKKKATINVSDKGNAVKLDVPSTEQKMATDKAAAATTDAPKKKRKNRGKKKSGGAAAVANPARLPSAPGGAASSNWKDLLSDLKKEDPTVGTKKKKNAAPPTKVPSGKMIEANKAKPKPDIWFDDVDEMLLDPEDRAALHADSEEEEKDVNGEKETDKAPAKGGGLVKESGFKGLTKIIGIDCEMVGVGHKGSQSVLARASLVNHFGHCIYDKFVKPREKVTDYRTFVSGIRPTDLVNATPFSVVQKEISDILKDRVLVGHSLNHDLKVLFLSHPKSMIRDTANYKPFKAAFNGRTPSLKRLSEQMLGVQVQQGEHSSVQDAQAAVRLYTMARKEWEKSIEDRRQERQAKKPKSKAAIAAEGKKTSVAVQPKVKAKTAPVYQDSDDE